MAIARQAKAAEILGRHPQALQLRYLETLTVIAADKNSTIVFPLPLDIVGPLLRWFDKKGGSQGGMAEQRSRGHWRGVTPAVCRRRPSMDSLPLRGGRGPGIAWDRPLVAEPGKSNDRLDATLECRLPNGGAV